MTTAFNKKHRHPVIARDLHKLTVFSKVATHSASWVHDELPACAGMTVPQSDAVLSGPEHTLCHFQYSIWWASARALTIQRNQANPLGALPLIRYASFMQEATDEQLMQRYAKGDAKAFDELYARHRGPLYRYFIRQVNNPATANDLYQGAWEKIIKARTKYRPSAPFTVWMYAIAHNHLVDHFRRLRPDDSVEADVLSDQKPGPVQGVMDGEQTEQLMAGITALPEEQKNTLLLKLETGLKMEEIAKVTGVSRETVKSRLRYAVNKLKRSLVE